MIEQILILADESASYTLGGLRLLERLLRGLEEDFTPAPGEDVPAPRISVLWRSTPPAGKWPWIDLPVKHVMNGSPRGSAAGPGNGPTLLLRSNVVFGRQVLPHLLRLHHSDVSLPLAPFALVDGV